ncbi:DUF4290 domain-containing protein [Penaeicola halotolerans]|uniref:DUF4290 domain-containing protein n=1 Tax=Penaeicola halotolerans TaxID=2793196 RepID=UPI001CF84AD0|nr:DUF4290 domain-containing protein [Penaeicola halotolerans]
MADHVQNKHNLILKEYGRNMQKLVDYVLTVPEKEKRTEYAYTLVELMKQLNPQLKSENDQKLWDDLFIMSNFSLDVDSPFPMPEKELLGKKPQPVPYSEGRLKFKHYGKNVELLIQKAIEIEDLEEQEQAIIYIGRLMKSFHATWNRDNFDENVIIENIKEMTGNKLKIDLNKLMNNGLFDGGINRAREFSSPEKENNRPKQNNRGNNNRRNNNFKKRKN